MADETGESILTDLMDQSLELFALEPRTVVIPATTWKKIADAQPTRLTLTVVSGTVNDTLIVSPIAYGSGALVTKVGDAQPIQIHASVWPLLIGGQWWAYSNAGQTCTVIEVIRQA